jgi:hypothetical protein
MEINEEQKQALRLWVDEGCGLSDIQKRLEEKFAISMTYMDVRFLIIDLGMNIQDKATTDTPPVVSDTEEIDSKDDYTESSVSLEIDRLMKPGALVSGKVTFSDGVTADWSLDQMGRLALSAGQPGYNPSQEDLQAFQLELKNALEKKGF